VKFEQYITDLITEQGTRIRGEDPDLDNVLTILQKDCSLFIRETGWFLYRGTNRQLERGVFISKQKPRLNRRPVDTRKRVHDMADKSFMKKFGWKVRSEGVFTATRPGMSRGYGKNLYLMFPVNGYKFVYSEDHYDFFIAQSQIESELRLRYKDPLYFLEQKDVDFLVDGYFGGNLKKAWRDKQAREVIFNCPNGYYYVDMVIIDELSKYLGIERY